MTSNAKSFERRDRLVAMQVEAQRLWEENKAFELDAAEPGSEEAKKEKYFVTFPYPYANGSLHLGHAFSLSKSEFAAGYQRMKGKRVLFPFAFHCTGMPIAACALRLGRELKEFGCPPVFPQAQDDVVAAEAAAAEQKKPAQKKGKLEKKKSKEIYQWNILKELGVPEHMIASFEDPLTWLNYFPPLAETHLRKFGLKADFRRAFITTEVNPFYDRFIQWQFNTLKKRAKVAFGNRLSIFSPIDNQPCADHDRASGEGVGVQEYTAIKMRVLDPLPASLAPFSASASGGIFMLAATLRPETMYGQTNCWILPTGTYAVVQGNNSELFVCSERSALNMSYQNLLPGFGTVSVLGSVSGASLLGAALSAPLCSFERVYTLPLLTISMNKGTGVVTSVPSDSPDDFVALEDIRKSESMRRKHGLSDEMVLPFEPVSVITIEGLGDMAAVKVVKDLKIKSQHDRKKLDIAKEKVYTDGFYKGVMNVGEFKGTSVAEAKDLVRKILVQRNEAFVYSEPERVVMSRSGNECVAALTDQWFLKYGEQQWMQAVREHVLTRLNTYSEAVRKRFVDTVDWLREWACSRSFGLGTKLPWDPQFVIESLSDSTIYMAYYTVSHLLQGGVLDGSVAGPLGIDAAELTDEVLDFVFLSAEMPTGSSVSEESLQRLRHEFNYWYPVDLRVSGKDLIGNHLTMALYNHAAIWPEQPEERWPRSYFTNGHAMLNGDKMSKSTGNFVTLLDACEQYSSDACRMALCDAGDGLEDANVALASTSNAAILRLTKEEDWIRWAMSSEAEATLRTTELTLADRIFENEMNKAIRDTDDAFANMQFRSGLKSGFFELLNARDVYRTYTGSGCMHRTLVHRFCEVFTLLLTPICPHFCEHIWKLMGKTGLVVDASYPVAGDVDKAVDAKAAYLATLSHHVHAKYSAALAPPKKQKKPVATPSPKPNSLQVFVAKEFPLWQKSTLQLLQNLYDQDVSLLKDRSGVSRALKGDVAVAAEFKRASKFAFSLLDDVLTKGRSVLQTVMPFDEAEFLQENLPVLLHDIDLTHVSVEASGDGSGGAAVPGSPAIRFTFKPDPQ